MATKPQEKQDPLRIAHYLIKYPCRVILTVLFILILTCVFDFFGFQFVPASGRSYYRKDDLNVNRKDALSLAINYLAQQSASIEPKTTEWTRYTLLMMYNTRDSTNILQPSHINDNIKYINHTNNRIPFTHYDEYYPLCLADTTDPYTTYPDCSSSAIYDPISSYFSKITNISQNHIDLFIDSNLNNTYTRGAFLSCFEDGFQTTRKSQYYRSYYRFGLPYPDIDPTTSSFKDANDDTDAQDEYYADYIFPIYQNIQIHENDHDNVEVVIMGSKCRSLQYSELITSGVLFATGSILTVFFIMCWHLNSLFLACAAMMQIMLCFPCAYFLYRYLFQVTYFDTMSTMVIFLILGIGADNVFVLVDAWVQSTTFVSNPDDLIERMSFAYRRAAKTMIVTTSTTFFAFMATALSPIMPIAGFGIWAGCVVVVNYLLVVSLYPAVLSFWYQKIRKHEKWPSCCVEFKNKICAGSRNKQEILKPLEFQQTTTNIDKETTTKVVDTPFVLNEKKQEARCMEKFLGGVFADNVIKMRWFILIFVLIMVGLSTWKAIGISPLTKQEQWFDEDHYMEKMYSWQQYFAGGAVTTLIEIKMVWGIKEKVDRTGVTFWDTEEYGKVVFDVDFNPSSAEAQEHLLSVCDTLLSNYTSMLYDINEYFECWIYDFMDYGQDLGHEYPFMFDNNNETKQQEIYYELIKNWTTTTKKGAKYLSKGYVGYMENELKFMFIEFTIPQSVYVPMDKKQEFYDVWEAIMNKFNEMAPNGVNKAYQIDGHAWSWMASEKGFITSAVQGIAIAMPLALLCLILSTQNWILSLFATSAIIGIICCEVAVMVLQGWELGIAESISIVMMIGFSVDYVVHLGNAYQECGESDKRIDKIKFSLFTMGISVVSGALTTFGSGFWLIFPAMLIFGKFGILVMTVVLFSLFFSMIYFIALLAAFGPHNGTGDIAINKWIGILFKPFRKYCYCKCLCDRICCIGTMDNYYDKNKELEINSINKATELTVSNTKIKVQTESDVVDSEGVFNNGQQYDDESYDEVP